MRKHRLLVAALLLAGCDRPGSAASLTQPRAPEPAASLAGEPTTTETPVASSESPVASSVATSARLPSYETVVEAGMRPCHPELPADVTDTSGIKLYLAHANECMRRRMVGALDEVLVPLKKSGSPRLDALMREQAAYNRFSAAFAGLVEDALWISLETGEVSYGSGYDSGQIECDASSIKERYFYARALGAGDAVRLAERMTELQQAGGKTREQIARVRNAARELSVRPVPDAGDEWSPEKVAELAVKAAHVESRARQLGAETCDNFEGLAAATGGVDACRRVAMNYYLAHCQLLD